MPTIYQLHLIGLLLLLIPATVNAKRRWDAEGVVTMRNGRPCFSYPRDEVIRSDKSYALFSLYVTKSSLSEPPSGWDIQLKNYKKKSLMEPNSSKTCIEYNIRPPEMREIEPAKSLLLDTPHYVVMDVEASGGDCRRFRSDFCLSRDAKGNTVLVGAEWDDKTNAMKCLNPGESPKRGLWQKLFGK